MTVLVTGATGHIGSNLVRALLKQGRKVRALVRGDTTSLDGLDVEKVRGDVLDRASLDPALDGVDVVYHLAALISIMPSEGPRIMHINIEGPRNIVDACLAHKVRRLVHFSSIHALLPPGGDNLTDETRPANLDPRAPFYDRSKALGELEVHNAIKERGLDAVIVNPTAVLGPYGFNPKLHLRVLLDIYHGTLPSLVEGGFNWVDSRDVAAGALAAEAKGRTGERYLLAGKWESVRVLAETVEKATGKKPPRLSVPVWLAHLGVPFAAAYARLTKTSPIYTGPSLRALGEHRNISHEKARTELGYTNRPLAETIADTFDFYDKVGLLRRGSTRGEPLRAAIAD